MSTIAEGRARLQGRSADGYAAIMNGLNLPNPKMMDVAVPANKLQGMVQEQIAKRGGTSRGTVGPARNHLDRPARKAERERHGALPGALHLPYPDLQASIAPAARCPDRRARPRLVRRYLPKRS